MLLLTLGKHLTLSTIIQVPWHPRLESPMQSHMSGVAFAMTRWPPCPAFPVHRWSWAADFSISFAECFIWGFVALISVLPSRNTVILSAKRANVYVLKRHDFFWWREVVQGFTRSCQQEDMLRKGEKDEVPRESKASEVIRRTRRENQWENLGRKGGELWKRHDRFWELYCLNLCLIKWFSSSYKLCQS